MRNKKYISNIFLIFNKKNTKKHLKQFNISLLKKNFHHYNLHTPEAILMVWVK